MESSDKKVFNIGTRSFVTALIVLLALMVFTYALTFLLPAGQYDRIVTDGTESIVNGSYHAVEGGLPF